MCFLYLHCGVEALSLEHYASKICVCACVCVRMRARGQVIGQGRRCLGLEKMTSVLDLVDTMFLLSCLLFKKLDPDLGHLGEYPVFHQ